MGDVWTTRRVLDWTVKDFAQRDIPSPKLDADLLVAHALGISRMALFLDLDRPLTDAELTSIRALVARRRKRECVAYILERRDFYGRTFIVRDGVLVPRPDTETIVEVCLARLESGKALRVLDLCTGSGCIGLTLAAERPDITVDLVDLSAKALVIARENVAALGLAARVSVYEGDLFEPLVEHEPYDLIVSNPPYIERAALETLDPEVRLEPAMALDGGDDGLDFYRRIVREAPSKLRPGGHLVFEVGMGQHTDVAELMRQAGFDDVGSRKDYGDIERAVFGKR